jgi:hypothetical protein
MDTWWHSNQSASTSSRVGSFLNPAAFNNSGPPLSYLHVEHNLPCSEICHRPTRANPWRLASLPFNAQWYQLANTLRRFISSLLLRCHQSGRAYFSLSFDTCQDTSWSSGIIYIYWSVVKGKMIHVLNHLRTMPWRHVGEWIYSSNFLDVGTRWRWVLSIRPLSLCTGKEPRCSLHRRLLISH